MLLSKYWRMTRPSLRLAPTRRQSLRNCASASAATQLVQLARRSQSTIKTTYDDTEQEDLHRPPHPRRSRGHEPVVRDGGGAAGHGARGGDQPGAAGFDVERRAAWLCDRRIVGGGERAGGSIRSTPGLLALRDPGGARQSGAARHH